VTAAATAVILSRIASWILVYRHANYKKAEAKYIDV
jgi:hypothetical protein